MTHAEELCTFVSDNLTLGIDMRHVREVVRDLPVTYVPLAPHAISGLVNLRGELLVAWDLRLRLGQASRASDALPSHVVLEAKTNSMSLLVDAMGDVMQVESACRIPAPDTMPSPLRDLVRAVYQRPDDLVLELDLEKIRNPVPLSPRNT